MNRKTQTVLGAALIAAGLFTGCQAVAEQRPVSSPVAGNKLFVPQGYKDDLAKMKLTEVAAMPYFSKPFITVAKDDAGGQHAVVFKTAEIAYMEKLPITYEEMCKIAGNPDPSNLHLFEINEKLYWSVSDGDGTRYWKLNGHETDPFSQSEEARVPNFYELFRNAPEVRIQYGDGNRLTVTNAAEIRELTALMADMVWEPVSGPDSVGYTFFLEIGNGDEEVRLSAAGHIVYQGKYYRNERKEASKDLTSAVVGYGQERIPGLLGLNKKRP